MRGTVLTTALTALMLVVLSAPSLAAERQPVIPGYICNKPASQRSQVFAVTAKTDWSRSQLSLSTRFTDRKWAKQVVNPHVRVIVRWKLRDGQRIIASDRFVSNISPDNGSDRTESWIDDLERDRKHGLRLEATVQYKLYYGLPGGLVNKGPANFGTVRRVTALPPEKTMKLRPITTVVRTCAELVPGTLG